jgi:hypothetical protein
VVGVMLKVVRQYLSKTSCVSKKKVKNIILAIKTKVLPVNFRVYPVIARKNNVATVLAIKVF